MTACRPKLRPALALGLVTTLAGALLPGTAAACGCFTPPDPSVPIIQAGERILFVHEGGQVTAYIQIQYSGKPAEFGWLLPLPSVPKNSQGQDGIDLGVDELFQQLTATTQPRYRVTQVQRDACGPSGGGGGGFGCGAHAVPDSAAGLGPQFGAAADMGAASPLVAQDSIGPYDFAILKADSQDEMLKWLADNHFFVPAGTAAGVTPYVHPGAYFLALKLRAGQSSGDLQPVVVRYQSDLPMIPLTLTAVGAARNMPIQVWMLGSGRAIPRNYYHVVLDDAHIDWFGGAQNYQDVVTRAVSEANGRHAFVTEYAGPSAVMRGVLDPPGRFDEGRIGRLGMQTSPVLFVLSLQQLGFQPSAQLYSILARYIPLPAALAAQGVNLAAYYRGLSFYLDQDRKAHPERYADIEAALQAFDPVKLTGELLARIVTPIKEASALFDTRPYLTRLFTTLSPEDMNRDPVFSYNPGLRDVPNQHGATATIHCDGTATILTESGMSVDQPYFGPFTAPALPYSQRIEVLGETGDPQVVRDNTPAMKAAMDQGAPNAPSGCTASHGGHAGQTGAGVLLLLLCALRLLLARSGKTRRVRA